MFEQYLRHVRNFVASGNDVSVSSLLRAKLSLGKRHKECQCDRDMDDASSELYKSARERVMVRDFHDQFPASAENERHAGGGQHGNRKRAARARW